MKKLNLYFGLFLLAVFLFTGYYMVNTILPQYGTDAYVRMANRADHVYMMFIAILNIVFYKCTFSNCNKLLETSSRILLTVAGTCSAIGFFIERFASLDERIISPSAVGLAFFAMVLFGIDSITGRKKI